MTASPDTMPMARGPLRPATRLLGLLVLAFAVKGCGEQNYEPSPAFPEGGTTDAPSGDACRPQSLSGWTPSWKPPRAPVLNACTDMQIQRQYALCENDVTYDAVACKAFQRDPANSGCRGCLFSTEDESTYGAIVIQKDRSAMANVAGCIALLEGDATSGGCGAKYQAVNTCFDAACRDACATNAAYLECRKAARDSVCSGYADDTSCANRPSHSTCTQATTFEEFFFLMARLFCSTGTTGSGARDAGVDASPAREGPGSLESPSWEATREAPPSWRGWATPGGARQAKRPLSAE